MTDKKKEKWWLYFEPKEDITAYEVAIVMKYITGPSNFKKDYENGTLLESVKRHIRIEKKQINDNPD